MDFRFRQYSPEYGIFYQPDTLVPDAYNPQALNRYMFELGNPYKYTDLDGHEVVTGLFAAFSNPVSALVVSVGFLGVGAYYGGLALREAYPPKELQSDLESAFTYAYATVIRDPSNMMFEELLKAMNEVGYWKDRIEITDMASGLDVDFDFSGDGPFISITHSFDNTISGLSYNWLFGSPKEVIEKPTLAKSKESFREKTSSSSVNSYTVTDKDGNTFTRHYGGGSYYDDR